MIEQSHGKARPTLPRSSDLRNVETARNPAAGRGPGGRFAAGNRISVHAGEKHAVSKLLGLASDNPDVMTVARDARRLFAGFLRDLPHDGQSVRDLVARRARHAAVEAYYVTKAAIAGLDTPEGQALDDRAMKHGMRAERLAVTSLDIATRLAAKRPPDAPTSLANALEVDE